MISTTPSLCWTESAFLQANVVVRVNAVNDCLPTRAASLLRSISNAAGHPSALDERMPKLGLRRLFDRLKCRQRHIIERMMGWLKENRWIVKCFDKHTKSYSIASLCHADICDIDFRTEL